MNYIEALHILGLSEGASEQEIKSSYRELAQIMHPDRFNHNEKLAQKASEQFKLITQAKEFLLHNKQAAQNYQQQASSNPHVDSKLSQLQIRYNAAETARLTLISYEDAEADRLKTYGLLTISGLLITFAGRRFPLFAALASSMFIIGLIGIIRASMQRRELKEQIQALEDEKKKIMQELTQEKA